MAPRNPTSEHDIQNEIRIWCGKNNLLAIRINVGVFRELYSERVITSGPPKGWPDLQLFDDQGNMCFCECKAKYGRLSDDQKKVHAILRTRKFTVIVPKTLDDFIREIEIWKSEMQKLNSVI